MADLVINTASLEQLQTSMQEIADDTSEPASIVSSIDGHTGNVGDIEFRLSMNDYIVQFATLNEKLGQQFTNASNYFQDVITASDAQDRALAHEEEVKSRWPAYGGKLDPDTMRD